MSASIVIDTNVLLAALKSSRGASYRLLTLIGTGHFTINISVPLILEYEAILLKYLAETALSTDDLDNILDYVCAVAHHQSIYYLWRPFLKDTKDDMVLELAVAASSQFIITFNQKDFGGIEQFGLRPLTPKAFLQLIGVVS
jgi:putative PIN family toxin of toxin-antitoxin system